MTTVVAVNTQAGQPTQAVHTVQHVTGNVGIHEPGKRHANVFRGLGATQVTIGCLSIILGAVAIILFYTTFTPYYVYTISNIASGIWSGIFFLIAGSLGIESAKMPTYSKINASMAMSIVASIFAFIMLCIESSAANVTQSFRTYPIHVILAILGVVEMIIAICQSAFCCAATCCGNRYQPPRTAVVTTTTTSTNQPVMVQQPGYQQQYVAPAPGVYPASQHGYVQPQQGYAQPQGYVQPQPGYAQPQPGYAQPQPGYAQPQQGYAQPQPGHSQQPPQTGYVPQDPGMVKQDLQQQGYAPQPAYAPQPEPAVPPAYSAVDPAASQEQYMTKS